MNLLIYLLLLSIVSMINSEINTVCSRYKLKNGRMRTKTNSKLVRFFCGKGYTLIGSKYSACFNGKFDVPPPICVNSKPTCQQIKGLNNGWAIQEANKIVSHFFCRPEFKLIGANITYCDGNKWTSQLPSCLPNNMTEPMKRCDFEADDLCGWSHDLNHDFDWKRTYAETPSAETGPKFDHTKGLNGNGHYMYIESTSRIKNDKSRLISPIYAKNATQFCVTFYYHMYGTGMGTLNVYVKQESEIFEKLTPLFTLSGNQGDVWRLGRINLENGTNEDFQVIFEGIRGGSYISDIAIDDVDIDECSFDEEMTSEDFEDFSVTPYFESCENRCDDKNDSISMENKCFCHENCYETNTCCADFIQFCFLASTNEYDDVEMSTKTSEDFIETSTNEETIVTTESSVATSHPQKIPTKPPTQTTKIPTKPPTQTTKIPTKPPTQTTKIPTKPPTQTTKIPTKPTTQTTKIPTKPPTQPTKNPRKPIIIPTQEQTTFLERFQNTLEIETDYIVTTEKPKVQYLQQNTKTNSSDATIYIGIISFVVFVAIVAVFIVVVKKYNLNCDKFKNSRNNDSMSDVRFLASDEVLDFTWKRSDSL